MSDDPPKPRLELSPPPVDGARLPEQQLPPRQRALWRQRVDPGKPLRAQLLLQSVVESLEVRVPPEHGSDSWLVDASRGDDFDLDAVELLLLFEEVERKKCV